MILGIDHPKPQGETAAAAERLHGLDALRAAALLSGLLMHSLQSWVVPGGVWAVGVAQPVAVPALLMYYIHSFRLPIFFLMAGYFGALVVGRRGTVAYMKDRAVRILAVFAVALYPMKYALETIWIAGGRQSGWLQLRSEMFKTPSYRLALASIGKETWPNIHLTHLWFLYYLSCITALFLAGEAVRRMTPDFSVYAMLSEALRHAAVSRWWPVFLAVPIVPLVAGMQSPLYLDTPDSSFAWDRRIMAVYGLFFCFGWWLRGQPDPLRVFARRRWWYLGVGLAAFLAACAAGVPLLTSSAGRWALSGAMCVSMTASVFGWTGAFLSWFPNASSRARYLADASYWIYIAHLPVVTGMQVLLYRYSLPWEMEIPLINLTAAMLLVWSYRAFVRHTWIGTWLNGRRVPESR